MRLLQLIVDKLYFRMKCEEVYVSPCCFANEPILESDSPASDHLFSATKVAMVALQIWRSVSITLKNIYVWLLLTMLAFPHLRITFENFSTHTPISKKLPLTMVNQLKFWLNTNYWKETMLKSSIAALVLFNDQNKKYIRLAVFIFQFHTWFFSPCFNKRRKGVFWKCNPTIKNQLLL